MAFLGLQHYPGELSALEEEVYGTSAHSDYEMITLLATDCVRELQIMYMMIDQTLFGELTSLRDTISVVEDLRKFTSWKHVEGTHWHTRFNHLINCGAGYYSYIYAKCLAATIWVDVCAKDPLSLATGTTLRAKLLPHGGEKEASTLLKDLVCSDNILKYHGKGLVPPQLNQPLSRNGAY